MRCSTLSPNEKARIQQKRNKDYRKAAGERDFLFWSENGGIEQLPSTSSIPVLANREIDVGPQR